MPAPSVEEELLSLEMQYWEAIKDQDVDTAMRLADDPCIVAGPQGLACIERKALGAMLKEARYTLRGFGLSDAQVRVLRDDVAIVAYRVSEELIVEGKPLTLEATDSSTWVRRSGRWVCALHSEALAGDPFGRDRTPRE
jgi:hypothetical protein